MKNKAKQKKISSFLKTKTKFTKILEDLEEIKNNEKKLTEYKHTPKISHLL